MIISKIISFEEMDSTNKYIKENLEQLESGTVIFAKQQRNGYGRRARVWFSEKGSTLTCSVLIKQPLRKDLGLITQCVAVSILKTLEKYEIKPMIKWPNDILVQGKKISGVLVENIVGETDVSVIIGIGININNKEFDPSIRDKATSLYLETKQTFDIVVFLNSLLEEFEQYYQNYLNQNTAFLEVCRTHSCLIGKEIILEKTHEKAYVKDIDHQGRLLIEKNGNEFVYTGNEVSLSNNYRSVSWLK